MSFEVERLRPGQEESGALQRLLRAGLAAPETSDAAARLFCCCTAVEELRACVRPLAQLLVEAVVREPREARRGAEWCSMAILEA